MTSWGMDLRSPEEKRREADADLVRAVETGHRMARTC